MIENEGRIKEQLTREEERNRELVQSVREHEETVDVQKSEIALLQADVLVTELMGIQYLYSLRPEDALGNMSESQLRALLKQFMLPAIASYRIRLAHGLLMHMQQFDVKSLDDLPDISLERKELRAFLKEAVQDAFKAHQLINTDGKVLHPCAHELIGLCMMDPRDPMDAP
jgi:hypothetical protein